MPGTAGTDALVAGAIRDSTLPVALVDLADYRILEVSAGGVAALGADREAVLGRSLAEYFPLQQCSDALELLRRGALDGYRARRRLRRADGSPAEADVWVRALGADRDTALVVFPPAGAEPAEDAPEPVSPDQPPLVLGDVDGEWRLDRLSTDVSAVLGYRVEDLAGTPFLALVHPRDAADLITAVEAAAEEGSGRTLRVQLRHADGTWVPCQVTVSPLDVGAPPRFAFALRRADPSVPPSPASRLAELELRLWRIAREVQAAGVLGELDLAPSAGALPGLSRLSSREWEVLTQLLAGARVPSIAQRLYLSPSTVRNHLSSIFRKLRVGSQQELIERVRAARSGQGV